MSRIADIAGRPAATLAALAVASAFLTVFGCGGDGDGPKRAVDSRTEVLRYFPAGAEVVALVNTDVQLRDLGVLSRTASSVPGWPQLRQEIGRVVRSSGLSVRREIAPLLDNELAIGARSLRDLADGRPLLVLEARDPRQLSVVLRKAVANGRFRQAGRYRRAALYRVPAAALAARDGVLLAGAGLPEVRRGLDIRDGDENARLDDDNVDEVLDELPSEPGIHAYFDLGRALDERLGRRIERRLDRIPWIAALGRAGISFALRPDSATVAFVARTERGSVADADLPIAPGEDPPPLHRLSPDLRAGLRGAGRAERFTRRVSAAAGRMLPVIERIEALVAEIRRGGPGDQTPVAGAAGALALDGPLRDALRAAGVPDRRLRRVPGRLRVSGYAAVSTDELRGRIEFLR